MNLTDIPLIDQHGHNLLQTQAAVEYPYAAAFTQGYDPEIIDYHARHTLFYRRSLRAMAALLNCQAEEAAILEHRQNLGLEKLTELCFQSANLEAIYLDDGLEPDSILPLSWHEQFVSVKRILRLEILAERLIPQCEDFATFITRFDDEIDPPPSNVVAFKSIACYRTGLAIATVSSEVAAQSFNNLKQQLQGQYLRLADKVLIDFLLQRALSIAAKYRLPIQFHTGFGDPDLDLRLANPLLLRPLLESPEYRQVPFVILHASYPYVRQAGYLACVYPHLYLDFGLTLPFLSFSGMRNTLRQLLELSPTSKLMYSSDAKFIPDLYYLAAKWSRQILAEVLEEAIADSDLTTKEAEAIAIAILRNNALALYRYCFKSGR
ncbi:amidohydrolase family protein [Myxosarcina sp. GI1(2024)]